ncbi:unnamed protein product [Cuscuta epithymum]|uniref:BHLH domain-containing protein n=1 Tax=Cuscuta epithymum TaxID=186058 RepID=A0AAV0CPM3_9ASTE|nr:unnamed protein product [Cuscuta epithymum]
MMTAAAEVNGGGVTKWEQQNYLLQPSEQQILTYFAGETRSSLWNREVGSGQQEETETESSKKRKAYNCKSRSPMGVGEEERREKNSKKESSKGSEGDYIHVRARRGQATDSHSLAERISERMKHLQDLVPGCNKITGKAGMLDEIINYVQSLQRQVEFLSMKLAAASPVMDFNNVIDSFYSQEMFEASGSNYPAHLHFGSLPECTELEIRPNPLGMEFRRTVNTPIPIHDRIRVHTSTVTWDANIPNLYGTEFHQGRSNSSLLQPFMGSIEEGNTSMAI